MIYQTGLGVAGIAAMTRLFGSSNAALGVVMLASFVPKILDGDTKALRNDLGRLATSLAISRGFSSSITWLLVAAGHGPVAKVGGTVAGILGSSVVAAHFDLDKAINRLREARDRQQRLRLA